MSRVSDLIRKYKIKYDSFPHRHGGIFVQIEKRDNPSLVEKPVIVGADPKGGKGRGVVSTACYIA